MTDAFVTCHFTTFWGFCCKVEVLFWDLLWEEDLCASWGLLFVVVVGLDYIKIIKIWGGFGSLFAVHG